MYIRKKRVDSYCYMLIAFIILLANTSWFIYGNVIFFGENGKCNPVKSESNPDSTQINPLLANTVRTMIWLGYLTMSKCCLYSTILLVGIPFLCYVRRRLERPNWEAAENNVLSRLAVSKFGAVVQETSKDCVICYEEFKADDQVTTLPCNAKHVFHKDCIKKWL